LRVGILGGAFNPPHIGHLVLAQEAHAQLGLDVVRLVPFARPPHRELEKEPGAEMRLAMCEQAIAGDSRFAVSRIELDREGLSYTVETLREMRTQCSDDDELVLILGGDQAVALPGWHEPAEVLSLAIVAVAEREEWRRSEVLDAIGALGGEVTFFDMPRVDVSSSLIRRRLRDGNPIRYLVPDAVAESIASRSLYGASPAAVTSS
jgi:nicotinate-nucleotide adenylyltransferase